MVDRRIDRTGPQGEPGGDRVEAAAAERVAAQQAPAGEQGARGGRRSGGSTRPRRRSRSARSGSGAASPARPSAGRRGSGSAPAVSRRTLLAGVLARSAPPRCTPRTASVPAVLDQGADLRAGDEDEVVLGRQLLRQAPERLAQRPLDPVALDRAADLAAHRDPQPEARRRRPRRGGSCRAPGSGSRARSPPGRRGRSPRSVTGADASAPRRHPLPSLRGQALAALAAPALDDRPTPAGTHAGAEPVGPGSLALLRLVGALHRSVSRQYTDAPSARRAAARRRTSESFLRHLRKGGSGAARAGAMVGAASEMRALRAPTAGDRANRRKGSPSAGTPRSTEPRQPGGRRGSRGIWRNLVRGSRAGCEPPCPSRPFASGSSRCARLGVRGQHPAARRPPTGSGPGPSGATAA